MISAVHCEPGWNLNGNGVPKSKYWAWRTRHRAGMTTFPPPLHYSVAGFDRCRREWGHGLFKYKGYITLYCGLGWGAAQSNFILSSAFRKFCSFEYEIDSTEDWKRDHIALCNEVSMFDRLPAIFFDGPFSWMSFFGRKENEKGLQNARVEAGGSLQSPTEDPSGGRVCTNILLGLNILVYVAQIVSQGKLMLWGAKVNSLINQGQIWRLVTSSLLHANIGHLLVNCYSLNSIGPTMEKLSGPKRFLTIYMASAVASSTMSYYLCKAPAVGASGAIFGLVGSLAVFLLRHNSLMSGGRQSLSVVARIIAVNMVLGLASPDIDNWGHMGGLIGGAALSWLLGPALSFESTHGGARRVLTDRPPVSYFLGWGRRHLR